MKRKTKSVEERFWEKVKKFPGENACWIWTAAKLPDGYGQFSIYTGHSFRAHRISFELEYGPYDRNFCVLHRCDNPSCVNPRHLFLGTYADNHRDMDQKGRRANNTGNLVFGEKCRGEVHHNARLKISDVLAIRADRGDNYKAAERFGISYRHLMQIKTRVRWRHIP